MTVTRLPVIAEACITSLPWVSWINCVRLVLVLICCSTLENCTSSVVNWLVSIGLVGSWFFNCVISNLRKSSKFADSEFSAVRWPVGAVAAAFALFCCAVTEARLMGWFPFASCDDVEAAARPALRRDRREFGVAGVRRAGLVSVRLAAIPLCAVRAVAVRPSRGHSWRGMGAGAASPRGAGSGEATWKVTLRPSAGTPAWSSACCNCG